MNNQSGSAIKIKRALKNKNTVTVICVLLIVIILLFGYQSRINKATRPIDVCFAKQTIQPRKQINDDMIGTKKVASVAVSDTVYVDCSLVRNKYANYNTIIPEGSMFYKGTVIEKAELPDAALIDLPTGYILYPLAVDMSSTYMNSLLPDNYLDIYLSTKDSSGKALVGKFLANVKIRAVRDVNGLNVFENSEEKRVPNRVFFAVPEAQFILLKQIEAINSNGIGSRIVMIPVPVNVTSEDDSTLIPTATSQFLTNYITNLSKDVPIEYENTNE